MKLYVSEWTVTRKKIRPSFNLGQLGLLFSISDRRGGPTLSAQDRLDVAYPYRLEVVVDGGFSGILAAGRYRLNPAETDDGARAWAESLAGRIWRTESGRGGPRVSGGRLVTDLTEYERLLWEELAAGQRPKLEFESEMVE